MKNPKLIICPKERELLMTWIIGATPASLKIRESLDKLYEELEYADVRPAEELPEDVVRINSIVSFGTTAGRRENMQLVLPRFADLQHNRLSVFTIMGSALIGYRQGTTINWTLPKGKETILLEKVDNSCLDGPEAIHPNEAKMDNVN